MNSSEKILTSIDGAIATLTFNNPERHNAMSFEMWHATADALEKLAADPSVRVVVLTGAGGKAFVSGADISKFETERASADAVAVYNAATDRVHTALLNYAKPTIALIRGFCLGGGVNIAVCCDLRIANDAARFAVPAAKLGLGYGYSAIRRLMDLIGPQFVQEILFTARSQFRRCGRAAALDSSTTSCPTRKSKHTRERTSEHNRRECANDYSRGQAYRSRSPERPQGSGSHGLRSACSAVLRKRRLSGRPPRVHGEAQTRFHRQIIGCNTRSAFYGSEAAPVIVEFRRRSGEDPSSQRTHLPTKRLVAAPPRNDGQGMSRAGD